MATSGSSNYNITARGLITFALRKINSIASTQDPPAEMAERGREELNLMLKEWMIHPGLWRKSFGVVQMKSPSISAITQANPAVVTTTAAHGLANGSRVTIASVSGMTEMNGVIATISSASGSTFTMTGIDASGFTAYTSGGVVRPIAYALDTDNPFAVIEARFRQISSGIARDIPMTQYTWTEYHELPTKGSTGISTNYHFNRGRGDGADHPVLHIWPVLATASNETIEYTYYRRIEDIDNIANNIDIGTEWLSTVGYNLGSRLSQDYGKSSKAVDETRRMAAQLYEQLLDADRDDFVQLEPDVRYG